ncbi:hypothetical protein NDU88_002761 [Pleurodeles waltl]|uniref:Uncharacterized protein n=1 Tax=Pleurodeles waltl TaxID=8319 RepID=A0AAV7Q9T7_PLEWA|nr:hypothetical protein NDU88_002761 [Pleurodeles waltl]
MATPKLPGGSGLGVLQTGRCPKSCEWRATVTEGAAEASQRKRCDRKCREFLHSLFPPILALKSHKNEAA